jgi:hypothetical protein
LGRRRIEHHFAAYHWCLKAIVGENNTGNKTWMNNRSALSPSAFFVVLSVRNRVNILFHGVCIILFAFIC